MAGLDDLTGGYRKFDRPGDHAIAKLAGRQHGVVAAWQLKPMGYSDSAIHRRAKAGRLHRLHRGVYAVGHRRLARRGRWMAAVLACGPEAVLSHRSAAALWELRPPASGPIDVTVPGRTRRGRAGIRVHNVRAMDPSDRATVDGIPVTSIHRTLLDYAEVAPEQQLRHALEEAERRELLDGRKLEELLARSPGRRGSRALREALAQLQGPAPWTQSELERRFLGLIREAGVAEPHCNVVIAGYVVDFFWPRQRLVIEVDGYHWHKTRRSFEGDRRKDTKLLLAGIRAMRVTQPRIEQDPRELIKEVSRLLSGGPAAEQGRADP